MLKPWQTRHLALLALRAFRLECAKARGRGEQPATDKAAFEAFRHDAVIRAVGKAGLRCCGQGDFKFVEAELLNILGETGKAFEAQLRAQTENRRQVEWKICRLCEEIGRPITYAAAICRTMYRGLDLEEASDSQLWNVYFKLKKQQTRLRHAA